MVPQGSQFLSYQSEISQIVVHIIDYNLEKFLIYNSQIEYNNLGPDAKP